MLFAADFTIAYSSDGVYLFSTRDEPQSNDLSKRSTILSRNPKRRKLDRKYLEDHKELNAHDTPGVLDVEMVDKEEGPSPTENPEVNAYHGEKVSEDEDNDSDGLDDDIIYSSVPTIHPRVRFSGACNVETVKDGKYQCLHYHLSR
jgi:hypothetical protein